MGRLRDEIRPQGRDQNFGGSSDIQGPWPQQPPRVTNTLFFLWFSIFVIFYFCQFCIYRFSSFALNSLSYGFHPTFCLPPKQDMLQPTPSLVSFPHRTSPWSERCYDDPNIWTSVRVDRRDEKTSPCLCWAPMQETSTRPRGTLTPSRLQSAGLNTLLWPPSPLPPLTLQIIKPVLFRKGATMFNFFFAFLEPFFLLPNCHGGFSKKNLHIYIFLYSGNYRVDIFV